eukprot:2898627-Rhodomonas_salina.3
MTDRRRQHRQTQDTHPTQRQSEPRDRKDTARGSYQLLVAGIEEALVSERVDFAEGHVGQHSRRLAPIRRLDVALEAVRRHPFEVEVLDRVLEAERELVVSEVRRRHAEARVDRLLLDQRLAPRHESMLLVALCEDMPRAENIMHTFKVPFGSVRGIALSGRRKQCGQHKRSAAQTWAASASRLSPYAKSELELRCGKVAPSMKVNL